MITFQDNPNHKRSKLVVLTEAGKAHHDKVKTGLLKALGEISRDLAQDDVEATARVLTHIMTELDRRIAADEA